MSQGQYIELKRLIREQAERIDALERALAEQSSPDGDAFYASKGPGGKYFIWQHGTRTGTTGYASEDEALAAAAELNDMTAEMRA